MMRTYRLSQNPSQSDADVPRCRSTHGVAGMGAQPDLSRVPEGSPGRPTPSQFPRSRARCTWLGPPDGRPSGRRSCAGSGTAVAGWRRTRCSARRAWLGHRRRSLALSLYHGGTPQLPPTSLGLASSGPGQQAGRRELRIPLGGDNKDRDPDSLLQHLPCLLFSLPLTKFTQEGNSFLPSLYEGRR